MRVTGTQRCFQVRWAVGVCESQSLLFFGFLLENNGMAKSHHVSAHVTTAFIPFTEHVTVVPLRRVHVRVKEMRMEPNGSSYSDDERCIVCHASFFCCVMKHSLFL